MRQPLLSIQPFIQRTPQALLCATLMLGCMVGLPPHAHADKYPTVKRASTFSRLIQRYTGLNFTSRIIATKVGERFLRKEVSGDIDINLKSYSSSDLIRKRLKSIELTGVDVQIEDAPLLKTVYIQSSKATPIFLDTNKKQLIRPVQLSLQATLPEEALNTYLAQTKVQDKYHHIKVPLPPFKSPEVITITQPHVSFHSGKIHTELIANLKGAPTKNAVSVSSKFIPVIKNNKVHLNDVNLIIPGLRSTKSIERFLERSFNDLLDLNHIVHVKKHHSRIQYTDVTVGEDNTLHLSATLLIAPRVK
jgi:hypothetical protein